MDDDRRVPFDSRGDLWSAVKDGIVVSKDLSPSLKFKPSELQSFAKLGPVQRAVSPPPSSFGRAARPRTRGPSYQEHVLARPGRLDKETQTTLSGADIEKYERDAVRRRRQRESAQKLVSLLVRFQMQNLYVDDSEGPSDKENDPP